jgi:hypothetical protein
VRWLEAEKRPLCHLKEHSDEKSRLNKRFLVPGEMTEQGMLPGERR